MRALLMSLLTGASIMGCGVDPVQITGTATVRWSIQSTFDPQLCAANGVTNTIIEVYFDSGALATRAIASCAAFQQTIVVGEGFYSARVTLADAALVPLTTTVTVPSFFVQRNTDVPVEVDFPFDSFLATIRNTKGE